MLARIGQGGGDRIHGRSEAPRHRGIGWNRVHVAIDDFTRLAYAEELPDESPETTAGFLRRASGFYADHSISIERILTDNGGCYRSRVFAAACDEHGLGHRRTRPYRPQTNGKAERMVRTMLSEWAYAGAFGDTSERIEALHRFLDFYNTATRTWDHPSGSKRAHSADSEHPVRPFPNTGRVQVGAIARRDGERPLRRRPVLTDAVDSPNGRCVEYDRSTGNPQGRHAA